jgi:hypothetical protein
VTEVTEVAKATTKLNAIGIAGNKTRGQETYILLGDVKLITDGCLPLPRPRPPSPPLARRMP